MLILFLRKGRIFLRIYMAWCMKRTINLDERALPPGCRVSSTPHHRFVFFEQVNFEIDYLKTLFVQFQQKGLHCRSLQLFSPGKLPDLTKYGFTKEETYYYYENGIIPISAVPFGEHEWCYMLRSDRGISLRALDVFPYFSEMKEQLTLDLDKGGKFYA